MRSFQRLCVFCGSSDNVAPVYVDAARAFGGLLAARGIGVVFGGGRVGLMGALADGALARGGEVTGVIPEALVARELAHDGVSRLVTTDGMHERKRVMAELADAFVALPGGFGTLEELFEVTTWTQLGFYRKPVGLLSVGGFFRPLLAFLEHAAGEGFIRPADRGLIVCAEDPERLLEALATAHLPEVPRWVENP